MSQHRYFTRTEKGADITVLMGWDRILRRYFMVLTGTLPATEQAPDGDRLSDPMVDGRAAFQPELSSLERKLLALGISVPGSMLTQLALDQVRNIGHRVVLYEVDGSFVET